MNLRERQIQFTLLENLGLLETSLGFSPTLLAAYLDLSPWGFSGQIDFVLTDPTDQPHVVELERVLDSQAKISHVVEQVQRYDVAARTIYPQVTTSPSSVLLHRPSAGRPLSHPT